MSCLTKGAKPNYFSAAVRYGAANTKTDDVFGVDVVTPGTAVEGQLECVDKTSVCDSSIALLNHGIASGMYIKNSDGIVYKCPVLDRLDRYMMSEDQSTLTRAEIEAFNVLVLHEDGAVGVDYILALDAAFVAMVNGTYICAEVSCG